MAQVGGRDVEVVPVLALVLADQPEAPVRAVVGLDGALEVVVDRVDLRQNLLRLGLLRGDRAGIGGRRGCGG
jgi:hypothetical protein